MGTHTVRLEPEAERALEEIKEAAGVTASTAIRKGIFVLRDQMRREAAETPFEVYQGLDLGPGGYAKVPARRAKQGLHEILLLKRKRRR
jgi:hypothetical protein